MAVISPPILKLLSDLDIDLMDIDNDMDYLRALMEAANALTISNPSDKRKISKYESASRQVDRQIKDLRF